MTLYNTFFILILALFVGKPSQRELSNTQLNSFHETFLCSGEKFIVEGKCTGSAYCTVCTNCSRCAYCKGGGSCGVCAKPVYKKSAPANAKKNIRETTTNRNSNSQNTNTPPSRINELEKSDSEKVNNEITLGAHLLTNKTSLRKSATHKSSVLARLDIGDEVIVIEKTTQYWWKVTYGQKTGWVKSFLLQPK